MRKIDKLRTRKVCPRCGGLNDTDRHICDRCLRGYPRLTNLEFCAQRFAKGNKKLEDEILATPIIQHAEGLAAYVNEEQFFGETTFVGVAIWEVLAAGYEPFANKWTATQFIEFLKSDVSAKRYGEYLATAKISEYRKRVCAEKKAVKHEVS